MGVDNVLGLTTQETNGIAVILGVAAVCTILCLPKIQVLIRGFKMKQQRRQEVQTILSDGFTEMIMDKIILKQITWDEARDEGFRRLKQAYPTCKDLYPSEDKLKERIEKRLGYVPVSEDLQNISDRTPIGTELKGMIARRK